MVSQGGEQLVSDKSPSVSEKMKSVKFVYFSTSFLKLLPNNFSYPFIIQGVNLVVVALHWRIFFFNTKLKLIIL